MQQLNYKRDSKNLSGLQYNKQSRSTYHCKKSSFIIDNDM